MYQKIGVAACLSWDAYVQALRADFGEPSQVFFECCRRGIQTFFLLVFTEEMTVFHSMFGYCVSIKYA